MKDVFISCSFKDKKIVEKIEEGLDENGVTYIAGLSNDDTEEELDAKTKKYIEKCKVVLLVWTDNSDNLKRVYNELSFASHLEKYILPFVIYIGEENKLGAVVYSAYPYVPAVLSPEYCEPYIPDVIQILTHMAGKKKSY